MRALARFLPVGLLAALVVALAAGCGGVTLDPVAAAATKTADAGSFRFTYSLSGSAAGQTGASFAGKGAYDAAAKRLSTTLDLAGKRLEAIADLGAASPTFYLHPPEPVGGKGWLKIDLGQVAKEYGVDVPQLSQDELDPSRSLDALKRSKYSTRVGRERIDGVETTHYLVSIDAKQLLQGQPDKERKLAEKALSTAGITGFPAEAWVGDDGLLRRLSIQLGGGPNAIFSLSMRMDFADYGSDVRVELPPADEVADGLRYLPTH